MRAVFGVTALDSGPIRFDGAPVERRSRSSITGTSSPKARWRSSRAAAGRRFATGVLVVAVACAVGIPAVIGGGDDAAKVGDIGGDARALASTVRDAGAVLGKPVRAIAITDVVAARARLRDGKLDVLYVGVAAFVQVGRADRDVLRRRDDHRLVPPRRRRAGRRARRGAVARARLRAARRSRPRVRSSPGSPTPPT